MLQIDLPGIHCEKNLFTNKGQGKMEVLRLSVNHVSGEGRGRMSTWSTEDFGESNTNTILCHTVMVDMWCYAHGGTHRTVRLKAWTLM